MASTLLGTLNRHGYKLYERSLRELLNGLSVFVACRDNKKYIGFEGSCKQACCKPAQQLTPDVAVWEPSWEIYESLKKYPGMAPVPCNRKASFGTGDRLGLVTAAHLAADSSYPVFVQEYHHE